MREKTTVFAVPAQMHDWEAAYAVAAVLQVVAGPSNVAVPGSSAGVTTAPTAGPFVVSFEHPAGAAGAGAVISNAVTAVIRSSIDGSSTERFTLGGVTHPDLVGIDRAHKQLALWRTRTNAREAPYELVVLDLSNGEIRSVTTVTAGHPTAPVWSEDGSEIAFASASELTFSVRADAAPQRTQLLVTVARAGGRAANLSASAYTSVQWDGQRAALGIVQAFETGPRGLRVWDINQYARELAAYDQPFAQALLWAGRTAVLISGRSEWLILDYARGGPPVPVATPAPHASLVSFDASGRYLLVATGPNVYRVLEISQAGFVVRATLTLPAGTEAFTLD